MKKIVLLIITILLFVFMPFKTVKASIALSPDTLSMLSNGADSLNVSSSANVGVLPDLSIIHDKTDYNEILSSMSGKGSINSVVTNNDITATYSWSELPYDVYDSMKDWDFCDSSGNTITTLDLTYATFDNGFYSGECLIDSNGNVVYRNVDGIVEDAQPLANIRQGGSAMTKQDWQNTYDNLAEYLHSHSMGYNFNMPSSINANSFYLSYGFASGSGPQYAESCYIANQYVEGLIIPAVGNNSYINAWYCNDLSMIHYEQLLGSTSTFTVTSGSWTVNGHTYNKRVSFGVGSNFSAENNMQSFENWYLSGGKGARLFGKSGLLNNMSLVNEDVMSFVGVAEMDSVWDIGDTVSVGGITTDEEDIWDTGSLSWNPAFDPTQGITGQNKAVVWEWDYPVSETIDPPLPFIDTDEEDSIPDDPTIPEDLPIVVPEGIPDLPIVNGLQNRFPFSIPWDLKNLFKAFRSQPVAPKFDIVWYIRPLDYTWEFHLDLAVFDAQADLFRKLFLVSFLIGLALFSYRHFFGQ